MKGRGLAIRPMAGRSTRRADSISTPHACSASRLSLALRCAGVCTPENRTRATPGIERRGHRRRPPSSQLALQGGALESANLRSTGRGQRPMWSATLARRSASMRSAAAGGNWPTATAPLAFNDGRWAIGPGLSESGQPRRCVSTLKDWRAADGRGRVTPVACRAAGLAERLVSRRASNPAAKSMAKRNSPTSGRRSGSGQGKLGLARGQLRYRAAGHARADCCRSSKPAHGAFEIAGERLHADAVLDVGEWLTLRAECRWRCGGGCSTARRVDW